MDQKIGEAQIYYPSGYQLTIKSGQGIIYFPPYSTIDYYPPSGMGENFTGPVGASFTVQECPTATPNEQCAVFTETLGTCTPLKKVPNSKTQ